MQSNYDQRNNGTDSKQVERAVEIMMIRLLEAAGASSDARAVPCREDMFVAKYEDGRKVVLGYILERKTKEDFLSLDGSAADLCNHW